MPSPNFIIPPFLYDPYSHSHINFIRMMMMRTTAAMMMMIHRSCSLYIFGFCDFEWWVRIFDGKKGLIIVWCELIQKERSEWRWICMCVYFCVYVFRMLTHQCKYSVKWLLIEIKILSTFEFVYYVDGGVR